MISPEAHSLSMILPAEPFNSAQELVRYVAFAMGIIIVARALFALVQIRRSRTSRSGPPAEYRTGVIKRFCAAPSNGQNVGFLFCCIDDALIYRVDGDADVFALTQTGDKVTFQASGKRILSFHNHNLSISWDPNGHIPKASPDQLVAAA